MQDKDKLILFAIAIGIPFVVGSSRAATSAYPYTAFINPAAVAAIADSLPESEPDFIIGAWDWVAHNITYDDFGTILYFTGEGVECDNCLLPSYVVAEGSSNCVGKSAVLTSILRNRLPADRVQMVVGELMAPDSCGHAWVRAEYNGTWYILEPTRAPPAQPWMTESSLSSRYIPDGYVNDLSFECFQPGLCIAILAHGGCVY